MSSHKMWLDISVQCSEGPWYLSVKCLANKCDYIDRDIVVWTYIYSDCQ